MSVEDFGAFANVTSTVKGRVLAVGRALSVAKIGSWSDVDLATGLEELAAV